MESVRHTVAHLLFLTLALCSILVSLPSESQDRNSQKSASAAGPVRTVMKNVMYHFTDTIAVHIHFLQGELLPTRPPEIAVFDDRESFLLNVAYAEIAVGCDSLGHALNEKVFAASDAPIKAVSVLSKGDRLIIRGKLHKKGDLPFETTGTVSPTTDGRIRLHAEKVKAAHLPVKGLMDLLGIEIANLINTNKVRGVTAEKDDLILDPQFTFPPPKIKGPVTAVRIQGSEIVLTFGEKQRSNFAARISGNFMAYRDNELAFGKLTMHDTDMILIDMDPQDPFDFFLDHYKEQLEAGYSKTLQNNGLRVYMRDYNKLKARTASRGRFSGRPIASTGPR
jgi:hypothetical protein